MTNLIVETSKYLMIFFMAIYTYANFRFFSFQDIRRKQKVCGRQNRCMFLIHFLAYLVLSLKAGDEVVRMQLWAFYAAQVVFFLCYIYLYRFIYRNVSRLLVNNTCMLLCVGFIMLTRLSMEKAIRQFLIAVAAAAVTWLIPYVMERVWQLCKLQWVYAAVGLSALLVVLVAGNQSFGAQLSLTLGGVSIQPSEFVKITFVFFVAAMFYRSLEFKTILVTTAVAALHVIIMVASKDLGGALIFFVTYIFMLFIATGNWLFLGAGAVCSVIASVLAYGLFDHVRRRVAAWSNPWLDIGDTGYQVTQSLFAIGTGGWFGLGLCQGMPGRIPVVEKDFIFSAISEEMGGIFAICVLLICLGCFLQFMMIATRMQAVFYKLLALGLGLEYIIQVFLTVGGVTKFIPSTGVTLPFVSYGGSSMFGTFILFGIIQGLYILKRNDEEELRRESPHHCAQGRSMEEEAGS